MKDECNEQNCQPPHVCAGGVCYCGPTDTNLGCPGGCCSMSNQNCQDPAKGDEVCVCKDPNSFVCGIELNGGFYGTACCDSSKYKGCIEGICCPNATDVLCLTECCDGTCMVDSGGNQFCCPKEQSACGKFCCNEGDVCVNNSTCCNPSGICAGSGKEICCANQVCCIGSDGQALGCCDANESCSYNVNGTMNCCNAGNAPCPGSLDGCCGADAYCDNDYKMCICHIPCGNDNSTCCASDEICIGGACCLMDKLCDNACCGALEECVNGKCQCKDEFTCAEGCCVCSEDNQCCSEDKLCGETLCCKSNEVCGFNQVAECECVPELRCGSACCLINEVCNNGECIAK